jgi:hypothetical protein
LGGGVIVGRGGKIIAATYMHDFKQANKALVNERMVYEVGKSEGCIRYSTVTGFIRHPLEIHADINPDLNGSLTKHYNKQLDIF